MSGQGQPPVKEGSKRAEGGRLFVVLILSTWIAARAASIFFGRQTSSDVADSFGSENAFYYSFYRQFLDSSDGFLVDRYSEAPNSINALRRFNIYQELCLALLYQGMQSLTPSLPAAATFYCGGVFVLYGVGVFTLLWMAGSIDAALLAAALYISCLKECSHVSWMPPLRENCAVPLWLLSCAALQDLHRRHEQRTVTFREKLPLLLSFTGFLLLWQFSCFALLLQAGALHAMMLLQLISVDFLAVVSQLYVWSILLSSCLRLGDTWAVRSPLFCVSVASVVALRLYTERPRWQGLLLGFVSWVAVAALLRLSLPPSEDDAHIQSFLLFRVQGLLHDVLPRLVAVPGKLDYHAALYAGQRSFSSPSLRELPAPLFAAGLLGALASIRCDFAAALRLFLGLATAPLFFLMLRYRMLFFPHLVLLGSSLAEIPVGRFRRPLVVALLAMAEANLYRAGVSWSQGHQTQSRDEEKVERERVMSWVRNHTSPEDILIGGMGTSALVRLHARRGIVCHPHYESARLRESCFWADKLVGHRSLAEYHDIISTKLLKGASRQAYVLVSLKDCFSVNEAGQSTSELVEMDEPWRLTQPKTCDLLYRLGFDGVPQGFQPRWLGRWYALLEVLADMKVPGKPLQPTSSRRCALGRYLLEEASEAEQARPLLTSLSPKALRKLPVACSCAAEMLGLSEVTHDAHARALQERDDPRAGAFGCCDVGPKFVACLSDKALRLMREASPSLAEIYFRKALEYTSTPRAAGFLAFARLQAGMNREALATFRRTAELEGSSPTGTTFCGEASASAGLGDFDGAADAIRRADHADSRQRCSEHHAGLMRKAFEQPSQEWLRGYRKLQEAWGSVGTVDGWRQFLQHPGVADSIQASIREGAEKARVLFLGRPSVHLHSVVQILRVFREVHNLHWPAEFWIEAADASMLDDDASQRLQALGAVLRAVPSPQGEFPEDHPFWRWQARFAVHYRQNPEAVSRLRAYSLKPVVLALSDCDPCFFLDADNVPLRSPQELIPTLDEFPALFWPDFWSAPRTGLWSSFPAAKSQESGQLMLRKTPEVQEALLLAALLAVRLDIFLEAIYGEQGHLMCGYGDKDVYQLAFRLLGVKFRMVGSSGPSVLVTAGGDYAGLVQLDDDRQSLFAHASKAKERLWQLLQADALQRCDLQEDQASNLACTSTRGAGSLSIPFDALRCTTLTFPGQDRLRQMLTKVRLACTERAAGRRPHSSTTGHCHRPEMRDATAQGGSRL
ncbi:dpy-19 [Symbiodinium sp. CCMP2592]|nr:dpy-19 [Symbiodinium sp. CCMP2592]